MGYLEMLRMSLRAIAKQSKILKISVSLEILDCFVAATRLLAMTILKVCLQPAVFNFYF